MLELNANSGELAISCLGGHNTGHFRVDYDSQVRAVLIREIEGLHEADITP